MRNVEKIQMIGNRLPGRPKGTLDQLLQKDMKKRETEGGAGNG